jgi:hypothetical protein
MNKTTINFLKYKEKANKMFNNKFNYDKFIYINAKNKSVIICPEHGEFMQNMDKHTANNSYGCKECWFKYGIIKNVNPEYKKEIISIDIVKQKLFNKFNDNITIFEENYKGITKKCKLNCKIHGEFINTPENVLTTDTGCNKCGREKAKKSMTDSYENLIIQVNKIHNNKYIYLNNDNYINKQSIITIICSEHGIFFKKAQKHVSGQGCFECKLKELILNDILIGGYNEELFINKPFLKEKKCLLYLLLINNEYYKIGITTKNINTRIKGLMSKAKYVGDNINIKILNIKEDTLYNCFILEQKILLENKNYRIIKKWSTEIFSNQINLEKLSIYFGN